MRILALAALVGTLAGCTPTLPADFGDELTSEGGCGDVYFYAFDADDTMLLEVMADGLIAAAQAAGEPTTTVYTLPDADLQVQVEVGSRISDAACDDLIENGGPQVAVVYAAVSGTATITVRPGDDLDGARADLQLTDVVFEPEGGGEAVTLESFEITDVSVGWYAG